MSLRKFKFLQRFSVWAATAVLVIQPQYVLAGEEQSILKSSTKNNVSQALAILDVAIQPNGQLQGQVVDKQGQPIANAELQLTNGRKQWLAKTNEKGVFQLAGLPGATYHLQVGQQVQVLRAWAPGTAPPSARNGVLFVQDSDVVLAQHCASPVCGSAVAAAKHPLANPWVIGGLIAAAVAIPVAIHNADDDDPPATP